MTLKIFFRKCKNFLPWLWKKFKYGFLWFLSNLAKHSVICWLIPGARSWIWKVCGVKMGKHICIGWDVFLDVMYAKFLTIEDDVWFANRSIVFCHRRDMDHYYIGEKYKECTQVPRLTVIKKGACVSIGATIMPGITIGEGAVIGTGAVVTRDVPAWSLVAGVPAKVIRMLDENPNKQIDKTNLTEQGQIQ